MSSIYETLRALATRTGADTEEAKEALAAAVQEARKTPSVFLQTDSAGSGDTLWMLAARSLNRRFLARAFERVNWRYWPSLGALVETLLEARAGARATTHCLQEVLYAVCIKSLLLAAHRADFEHECGQQGRVVAAAGEGEDGAALGERLARDAVLAPALLERLAAAYPRVYREFATSSARLCVPASGAPAYIEMRAFWLESGTRPHQVAARPVDGGFVYERANTGASSAQSCCCAHDGGSGERAVCTPPVVVPVRIFEADYDAAFFTLVDLDDVVGAEMCLANDPTLAEQRDDDERMPLHQARSAAMVDALLRGRDGAARTALLEARDRAGFTPLHAVALVPREETEPALARLLAHGAQIASVDGDGRTCVHWAAMCTGDGGATLRMLEAMRRHDPIAFVKAACTANNYGETALHTCALALAGSGTSRATSERIVEMLVAAGASRDDVDTEGRTAGERVDARLRTVLEREERIARAGAGASEMAALTGGEAVFAS